MDVSPDAPLLLHVTPQDEGTRLDVFLACRVPDLSRRHAQALVEAGEALLNGHKARKADELRAGDLVEMKSVPAGGWRSPAADPNAPLEVVHVDAAIIALSKPPGMPSVPLTSHELATVAGALVARFPECALVGRRPGDGGLLQRLDTSTSGLMLAARSQPHFDTLLAQQNAGQIPKIYFAVVPDIELPPVVSYGLEPSGPKGRQMRPAATGGVAARTELKLVSRGHGFALVQAMILHGARHQIRAHLASCGAPILGDELYGGAHFERLLLHAHELRLAHPLDGRGMVLRSELPVGFWPLTRA